ncbi:hypothetical protein HYH03_016862 [Edaphochlamys debaryana]|uniref:Guanylate cyclase domain-containing protein n=1 Tax=Edaphochlamys debaryana TaxID=47281 RepID=A0A835XJ28_9CHLO|nr:hypothetical protein HYH03_016862 [Edaphochlamys debaryana]|eukprot:KAG2484320.1 hypothetical protein HYH03_016862 [Edaphochlamys debaryana]
MSLLLEALESAGLIVGAFTSDGYVRALYWLLPGAELTLNLRRHVLDLSDGARPFFTDPGGLEGYLGSVNYADLLEAVERDEGAFSAVIRVPEPCAYPDTQAAWGLLPSSVSRVVEGPLDEILSIELLCPPTGRPGAEEATALRLREPATTADGAVAADGPSGARSELLGSLSGVAGPSGGAAQAPPSGGPATGAAVTPGPEPELPQLRCSQRSLSHGHQAGQSTSSGLGSGPGGSGCLPASASTMASAASPSHSPHAASGSGPGPGPGPSRPRRNTTRDRLQNLLSSLDGPELSTATGAGGTGAGGTGAGPGISASGAAAPITSRPSSQSRVPYTTTTAPGSPGNAPGSPWGQGQGLASSYREARESSPEADGEGCGTRLGVATESPRAAAAAATAAAAGGGCSPGLRVRPHMVQRRSALGSRTGSGALGPPPPSSASAALWSAGAGDPLQGEQPAQTWPSYVHITIKHRAAAPAPTGSTGAGDAPHAADTPTAPPPPLLFLRASDVTCWVEARERLEGLLQEEHKVLEAIFPRHVIEHVVRNAAARAGSGLPIPGPAASAAAAQTASAAGGTLRDPTHLAAASSGASSPRTLGRSETMASVSAAGNVAATPQLTATTSLLRSVPGRTSAAGAAAAAIAAVDSRRRAQAAAAAAAGPQGLPLATAHKNVTVLFADICGFTSMCNELEPLAVMAFLNGLFTRLDSLCDIYGVYKVETIGDCIMVCGGLITVDAEGFKAVRCDGSEDELHALKVLCFAKAMLREVAHMTLPHNGRPLRMRVGLHSGPVTAGIVGAKMPRFCLFGDTVNTASRMESTCEPGCVHVSAATRALLPEEPWIPTGGVQVKGKGEMQTFTWRPPASADPGALLPGGASAVRPASGLPPQAPAHVGAGPGPRGMSPWQSGPVVLPSGHQQVFDHLLKLLESSSAPHPHPQRSSGLRATSRASGDGDRGLSDGGGGGAGGGGGGSGAGSAQPSADAPSPEADAGVPGSGGGEGSV